MKSLIAFWSHNFKCVKITYVTGVCRSAARGDSEFLAGKSNHHLEYSHGTLVLNYTAGDKCVHNGFTANTIITFVCGADGSGDGEPVMQGETDDCTYYVAWHTELACEKKVTAIFHGM